MAYQRFGDNSDLYIWMSNTALHIWASQNPKTFTVHQDGVTEIRFDERNIKEAETLFIALYDHLLSKGRIVEINKKRRELKVRKPKKDD